MDLRTNNKLYGTVEGVHYGQNERVDELNTRIGSRQFPDSPLEPNYDPRSIPTKYSLFPVVNRRAPATKPILPYVEYNVTANFNPGSHRAPPSGFLTNVDTETILRNQTFALQRGADQSVYVPSSQSELYKVRLPIPSQSEPQPHPDLFQQYQFDPFLHPNAQDPNIGRDKFFNHTRTQLRGT
jgi:hypothetical protein